MWLSVFSILSALFSQTTIWKEKMDALLTDFPDIDTAAMGFPSGWENEPLL